MNTHGWSVMIQWKWHFPAKVHQSFWHTCKCYVEFAVNPAEQKYLNTREMQRESGINKSKGIFIIIATTAHHVNVWNLVTDYFQSQEFHYSSFAPDNKTHRSFSVVLYFCETWQHTLDVALCWNLPFTSQWDNTHILNRLS